MAFFTLANNPFESSAPQVKGSVVLFRDKLGRLIICEPEPISTKTGTTKGFTTAPPHHKLLPSISEPIKTINTTINAEALQKYTILEGSDGNKYLSPISSSIDWSQQQQPNNLPHLQVIQSPPIQIDSVLEDTEDDEEIPPYQLDHMYARKPVEPGDQSSKRLSKRRTRKNSVKPEIFIEGLMEDNNLDAQAVNLNIIRPTLPSTTSSTRQVSSRPRILNVRETPNSAKLEHSHRTTLAKDNPSAKSRQRKTTNTVEGIGSSSPNYYSESDLSQLGAFVTIGSEDNEVLCHGSNPNTELINSMISSSGSTKPLEQKRVEESQQDDSALYFQFSTDEVEQVVI